MPAVELVVVGAGPAYTDRAGAVGAAYLLLGGGSSLLLDLGQGAFPNLARTIEPSSLGGVVISHLHPDHFIDLVPLRHYLRYEFRPSRRVRVLAPSGLDRRLDALHDEPGFTAAALDVAALAPGRHALGPFEVEARLVTHAKESYGFRVSAGGGRAIVYSGDCGVEADLRPLIRPGDILLTEVAFGPGPVPTTAIHLDGPSVGDLAAATRPSEVLLTHLQMGYDEAETIASVRSRFEGPVRFVAPGDRLSV